MDIRLIHDLLLKKNIRTIVSDTSIEEDQGPWENYYKLRLKEDKWEFVFVEWEKSDGREKVLKIFDDEQTASKFFYLYQLHYYYLDNYLLPFAQKNKDINVRTRQFNFKNLQEALHRLGIPSEYYSLDGKLKEHCIVLDKVNDQEGKVKFIGKNNKIISESLVLENWLAHLAVYQRVYSLFLLDQEWQRLLDEKVIAHGLTDEEYYMFLSPGV